MVTLTGVAAGLGVVLVMLAYLKLSRQPLVDRDVLNEADHAAEAHISLVGGALPLAAADRFCDPGQCSLSCPSST